MKLRITIALMVALALVVSACGDDDTATTVATTAAITTTAGGGGDTTDATQATTTTTEESETLRVARTASFDGWVLDSGASYVSYMTHLAVLEPLLRFGADGKTLEPGLAAEWSYDPDALMITFTLQEGARFSNGEPVTAEDVAFSLERWRAGPNFGLSWESIAAVTGEGREIVIELAFPDNTILPVMASSVSGIMPKDFAGMTENDFYNNPIGAGAFKVEEWSLGGRIVLTPNEYFYDPARPYVDEVVIDVVASETARQILFDGGQADIVEYLSPTVARQYDQAVVHPSVVHSIQYIALNVLTPPFDDPLVRQAVAYAVDYEAVAAGLGEYYTEPRGLLPPNTPNWVPPTESYYRRDLAMAQDLIAQSAAADGADVEYIYDSGNEMVKLIAQIVQANLAEIGINVNLTGLETGAFLDRAFSFDAEIAGWDYGAIMPDMSDPLAWIMATGWLFSGFETDTLLEDFLAYADAATEADMQAVVAKIQDDAFDTAAVIAVAEGSLLHVVSSNLIGFEAAPMGMYYYDTLEFGG